MSDNKDKFWTTLTGLIAAIGGLIGAISGLIVALNSIPEKQQVTETRQVNEGLSSITSKSSFYCELKADTNKGGKVYTVMYRRNEKTMPKPWLKMVRSMGEVWAPQKRCEEIARRLDLFRQQGLFAFCYRKEPKTPNQYVLCAKTKSSGNDSCPLVLTLLPEDDPIEELEEVAEALLPGNPASYQTSGDLTVENPVCISVEEQL